MTSFIVLAIANAQTAPTQSQYKLVWNDEFNGTTVDTNKWSVVHQTKSTESHHQGRYLTRNTSVGGGNLQIVTERHCIINGELPSTANRSEAPCPSGATTAYSSGQVKSAYNWASGKMEIRAKMPNTTQSGLWSGFWLRQEGKWCTSQYGEIDILEWYSDPKSTNASTATTHISCANNDLTSRQHVQHVTGSLADSWHTWGVEWDKSGVTYYLDGKVVKSISSHRPNDSDQNKDTYDDFDGVSKEFFEQVVGMPWQLRVNTQVYPSDDQWHEAPDNAATFKPQTMLVDYVRVYSVDQNTPTAPTTPVTPTTPTDTTPVAPVEDSEAAPVQKDEPTINDETTQPATPTTPPAKKDDETTPSTTTPTGDRTTIVTSQEEVKNEATEETTTPETTDATTPTNRQSPLVQESIPPTQTATSEAPTTNTGTTPNTLPQTGSAFWPALGSAPFALVAAISVLRYHLRSRN